MRHLWPLLLAHNRLNVNLNIGADNLHELEECVIGQSVSFFGLDVLHH